MDWQSLLIGKDDWQFLMDVSLRTFIMFMVVLISLRLLGKRGIHQLSVFELGVIIGLGSAAGDPMLYKDVGVLPSMVVFIIVVLMYRLIVYLISKSDRIETFIEGRASYILKEGVILKAFEKQPLAHDELLATLRQDHVFHLGQVQSVIIEADGKLSIFFYPDDEVKFGLPILPDAFDGQFSTIIEQGIYSCSACGYTKELTPSKAYSCIRCNHTKCLKAINGLRVR